MSVVGTDDTIVPPHYSIDPNLPGALEMVEVDGAGHMDLIDPEHPAWAAATGALVDVAPPGADDQPG